MLRRLVSSASFSFLLFCHRRVVIAVLLLTYLSMSTFAAGMCGCEHRFAILMDFYNATGGPQWRNRLGWGSMSPCNTTWYDVTCNGTDVIRIYLGNNKLRGTLVDSFAALSGLVFLDLTTNSLVGPIPPSWSSMSSLQYLSLDKNDLSGTLPAVWSTLTRLQNVYLYGNSFTGTLPPTWSAMTNLELLYLYDNKFNGTLPPTWSQLRSLRDLRLDTNSLLGTLPHSWSNLTNLRFLWVHSNCLRGPVPSSYASLVSLLGGPPYGLRTCNSRISSNTTTLPSAKVAPCTAGPANDWPAYCADLQPDILTATRSGTAAPCSSSTVSAGFSRQTSGVVHYSDSASQSLSMSTTLHATTPHRTSSSSMLHCTGTEGLQVSLAAVEADHSMMSRNASSERFGDDEGVANVLMSDASSSFASTNGSDGVAVFVGEAAPVQREVLSKRPVFVLNLSVVQSPAEHSDVRWTVTALRMNEAVMLNFTTAARNVQRHSWHEVRVSPPSGAGWLPPATSLFVDSNIVLTLTLTCDSVSDLLVRLRVPIPIMEVWGMESVMRITTVTEIVGSVVSGGPSAGAIGRLTATRSMVTCGADSPTRQGVVDFDFVLCDSDAFGTAASTARSAIASNALAVTAAACSLVLFGYLWTIAFRTSMWEGLQVALFPSTLLPIGTMVIPSSAGGVVVLASQVQSTNCAASDVLLVVLGAVLSAGTTGAIAVLWVRHIRTAVGQQAAWVLTEAAPDSSSKWVAWRLVAVVVLQRWRWRSTIADDAASVGLRHAWLVLQEYRAVWYAGLDSGCVVLLSVLGAASGLESPAACQVCSAAALAILVLQAVVVVWQRPFMTVFSTVHAATTLALTAVSVALQLAFLLAGDDGMLGGSGKALLSASTACCLVVVGVTLMKQALDVCGMVRYLHRRLAECRLLCLGASQAKHDAALLTECSEELNEEASETVDAFRTLYDSASVCAHDDCSTDYRSFGDFAGVILSSSPNTSYSLATDEEGTESREASKRNPLSDCSGVFLYMLDATETNAEGSQLLRVPCCHAAAGDLNSAISDILS